MKSLSWYCRFVEYRDVVPANRPAGIHQEPPTPAEYSAAGVLFSMVTIEAADDDRIADDMASEIFKLNGMFHPAAGVHIVPFGHLSSDLANPRMARDLVDVVAAAVERRGCVVSVATFGFHKHLTMVVPPYKGSVAYRARS